MPKTEVILTEIEKQNWREYCLNQGSSEADTLRMLIHQLSPDASSLDGFKEIKSNKITIRLSNENLQKLSYRAKAEGYTSQTHWATASVLSNLHRQPILTTDEMACLRNSNRQLAAMGRNLNQIARVLNIEFRESDKITKYMIENLSKQIDKHTEKVYRLLDKNRTRWNIANVTAS